MFRAGRRAARHIVADPSAPHTRRDAGLWRLRPTEPGNASGMSDFGDTVDREDIDRFAAQSAAWRDPEGSFRPLHRINPTRLDFLRPPPPAGLGPGSTALRPFGGL